MAWAMMTSVQIEESASGGGKVYIDGAKVSSVTAVDVAFRPGSLPLVTLTLIPSAPPMRLDAVDLRVVLTDTPEAVQRSLMRCLQEKYGP